MIDSILSTINRALILRGWALAPYPPPPSFNFMEAHTLASALVMETRNVPGCIIECGVAFGRGLLALLHAERKFGTGRRVFGFDTFTGYPSVTERDVSRLTLKEGRVAGTLKNGNLAWSRDDAMRFIRNSGIEPDALKSLTLIEGDVAKTLPAFNETVAVAVLEMDLYESTKAALLALRDKMAKGGAIVPLNYGSKFAASTDAVHEVFPQRTFDPCPTMPDKIVIRF